MELMQTQSQQLNYQQLQGVALLQMGSLELEQYLRDMDFIPCVIEGEETPDYWAFHPKEQAVKNARFRPDGAVSAVCSLGLTPIFIVPNYKKVSYVINLALAESLLRRGYVNLGLERLEKM